MTPKKTQDISEVIRYVLETKYYNDTLTDLFKRDLTLTFVLFTIIPWLREMASNGNSFQSYQTVVLEQGWYTIRIETP
jgi:hypothetical protein